MNQQAMNDSSTLLERVLREADRLVSELSHDHPHQDIARSHLRRLVTLLRAKGLEVFPAESHPTHDELRTWLEASSLRAGDDRLILDDISITVRPTDPDDAENRILVLRRVLREPLQEETKGQGRAAVEFRLGGAARMYRALRAAEDSLGTATENEVALSILLKARQRLLLKACGTVSSEELLEIPVVAIRNIEHLMQDEQDSEKRKRLLCACEEMALALQPELRVLDAAFFKERRDPNFTRKSVEVVIRTYSKEDAKNTILGIMQNGVAQFNREGDEKILIRARAKVSRGPMPDDRRFLESAIDLLQEHEDHGLPAQTFVRWAERYDSSRDPATELPKILMEIVIQIDLLAAPGPELQSARENALVMLGSRGIRAIEPDRREYPDDMPSSTRGIYYWTRYLEAGEDPDRYPAGIVLSVQTGFQNPEGEVLRRARVLISAGVKPKIIEAIDQLESETKDGQSLPFAESLTLIRNLVSKYSRTTTPAESKALADRMATETLEVVVQMENDAAYSNSDALDQFRDFLRRRGIRSIPDPDEKGLPGPTDENADDYYEIIREPSAVTPKGHVIDTLKNGYWDERNGKVLQRGKVLLSEGEEDELDRRILEVKRSPAVQSVEHEFVPLLDKLLACNRRRIDAADRSGSYVPEEILADERAAIVDLLECVDGGPETLPHNELKPETAKLLRAVVAPLQLEIIPPFEGDFDRRFYQDPEAFAHISSSYDENHPPGFLLRVVRRGLRYRNRSLRPASVHISRGPKPGVVVFLERTQELLQKDNDSGLSELRETALNLIEDWESLYAERPPWTRGLFDAAAKAVLAFAHGAERLAKTKSRDDISFALRGLREDTLMRDLRNRYPGLSIVERPAKPIDVKARAGSGFEFELEPNPEPRGTLLEELRPCYYWSNEDEKRVVLLAGRLRVSVGPAPAYLTELIQWNERLSQVPETSNLAEKTRRYLQEFERDLEDQPLTAHEYATMAEILSELDDFVSSTTDSDVDDVIPSRGPLGDSLLDAGWSRLPENTVFSETLCREDYEIEARFDEESGCGQILEVRRAGWVSPKGRVAVKARIALSRGPGAFLEPLLFRRTFVELSKQSVEIANCLSHLRDPFHWFNSKKDALLFGYRLYITSLSESRGESCAEEIKQLLDSQGAELFPKLGDKHREFPREVFSEVTFEFHPDYPFGRICRASTPGLRWNGEVLCKGAVAVSRGQETDDTRMFQKLADVARQLRGVVSTAQVAANLEQFAQEFERENLDPTSSQLVSNLIRVLHLLDGVLAFDEVRNESVRSSCESLCQDIINSLQRKKYTVIPFAKSVPITELEDNALVGKLIAWMDERIPAGQILRVRRHGIRHRDKTVMYKAEIVYCKGPPNELFLLLQDLWTALVEVSAVAPFGSDRRKFEDVLSRAADLTDEDQHQPAIQAMDLLYDLRNRDKLTPLQIRDRMKAVRNFLLRRGVREIIKLGDKRAVINRELQKIRIVNRDSFRPNDDFKVVRILRPGFIKDNQTVQMAVVEVGM